MRDLGALRAHLDGDHGFGAARMLPLKVLLSIHEQEHAGHEGTWGGSADASRSPGFIARRG